jgi:hypothetical protein
VGFQRHAVKFSRRSHSSSPASMADWSSVRLGRLGPAPGFRKSRLRIFTDQGTVDSVRRTPPGFVGALLGRFHGICDASLALRRWRKRRSQTGKCPADALGNHGALRVCVGVVSLGLYVQLATLYVCTAFWLVHYGRQSTPGHHYSGAETASPRLTPATPDDERRGMSRSHVD